MEEETGLSLGKLSEVHHGAHHIDQRVLPEVV